MDKRRYTDITELKSIDINEIDGGKYKTSEVQVGMVKHKKIKFKMRKIV